MNKNLVDESAYLSTPQTLSRGHDRRIFKNLGGKKTRNPSKVSFKFEDNKH